MLRRTYEMEIGDSRFSMFWDRSLSLFSPQMLSERQHRGLLLQFLLSDLFEAMKRLDRGEDLKSILSSHAYFFPYDWAKPIGHLNKVQEHALLLKEGFPEEKKIILLCEKTISTFFFPRNGGKKLKTASFEKGIQSLYLALEPLIQKCREDENLLFFLLKNKPMIDRIVEKGHLHLFLQTLYPEGLEILGEKMCDRYHRRGFFSQIPEFKLLLSELL